jgi:hypothetical protein
VTTLPGRDRGQRELGFEAIFRWKTSVSEENAQAERPWQSRDSRRSRAGTPAGHLGTELRGGASPMPRVARPPHAAKWLRVPVGLPPRNARFISRSSPRPKPCPSRTATFISRSSPRPTPSILNPFPRPLPWPRPYRDIHLAVFAPCHARPAALKRLESLHRSVHRSARFCYATGPQFDFAFPLLPPSPLRLPQEIKEARRNSAGLLPSSLLTYSLLT